MGAPALGERVYDERMTSAEAVPPTVESVHVPENWSSGRLLSTAARLVERAWADALEQLGLTHAGLIVLQLLESGVTTQAELARHARVEAQTMSRTVDRLEREGLVERVPDAADRRRHIIRMTHSGAAIWQRSLGLEKTVFPEVDDPDALRAALLQIVHAPAVARRA
ncbi:hypothetical protein GCM10009617_30980 [Leifsonia poae]|uniref:HTH marR-type domain-containing protein n=2 Tax=Leifsonia poae TaxID=110933 RepID=A0A9W6HA84_9MICO|nr:hypothetical protein GCM10017584_18880 [Leifsonia poae]